MSDGQGGVIVFTGEATRFTDDRIVLRGMALKPGVTLKAQVLEVGETTVELGLYVANDVEVDEDNESYTFEVRMEPATVVDNRLVDIMSFLRGQFEELDKFMHGLFAYVIMTEGKLIVENGGFSANIYLELRGYSEMIEIEREEAEKFFVFME